VLAEVDEVGNGVTREDLGWKGWDGKERSENAREWTGRSAKRLEVKAPLPVLVAKQLGGQWVRGGEVWGEEGLEGVVCCERRGTGRRGGRGVGEGGGGGESLGSLKAIKVKVLEWERPQ